MPYRVIQRGDKYCVQKIDDNAIMGCHPTRADAVHQIAAIEANEGKRAPRKAMGDTIKAQSPRRVGGYLVRFTSENDPDLHGEYFDKRTYFWDKEYPIKGKPILIDHAFDSKFKGLPVGIVDFVKEDEVGLWIEGKLKERDEYLEYLRNMRGKGVIDLPDDVLPKLAANIEKAVRMFFDTGQTQWSSGAHPQLVELGDNGHIKSWPIIEATAVMTPAEPDGTETRALRSALDGIDALLTSIQPPLERKEPTEAKGATGDVGESNTPNSTNTTTKDDSKMDENMIRDIVRLVLEEYMAQMSEDDKMEVTEDEVMEAVNMDDYEDKADDMADDMDDEDMAKAVSERAWSFIRKRIEKREKALAAAKVAARSGISEWQKRQPVDDDAYLPAGKANGNRGASSRIEVRSQYADWNAADFSFAAGVASMTRAAGRSIGWSPDQKFYREFADRAEKAYRNGKIKLTPGAVKSLNAIKSDDLDYSTQAGFGDEWVPTVWANNVWDKPRIDNVVPNIFDVIEMPSNPYEYPVESTDPTVSLVPETQDENQLTLADSNSPIPDTKIGTDKVTFTAKKLGLRVGISSELQEDGIARLIPKFREQSERAMLDAMDYVAINGDTATSGNINLDGGTPGATARYLAYNGLIKQPLGTSTSNAIDLSGASPTLAHIRQARFSLGVDVSPNPMNLAIICDAATYGKLLSLDEVVTVDRYGTQATVLTGELGRLDGMPIFVSAQMPLADTDGKVTDGGNTTDTGRLLVVHRPSWYMGFRRRISQTMVYIPYYDAWQLVITLRNDFKGRTMSDGTQQSSDDTVALLYNIGV